MNAPEPPSMHSHRTPDVALWDQYRALREQWTHEDMLVSHRVTWLILSSGLLFTAYGAEAGGSGLWLALPSPLFGMLLSALIGVSIHAAMAATDDVRREFDRACLADLCPLAPTGRLARRGRWVAKALPFVFGAMWLLALLGSLQG